MGEVPLHFALNNCGWLILPYVEVLFEVEAQVLLTRKIHYNPVWFYASPESCTKTSKLDIIRKNNEFLILNETGEIGNKLLCIRVVKETKPAFDS